MPKEIMKKINLDQRAADSAKSYTLPEDRDPEANWAKLEAMLEEEKPRRKAAFWYWAAAASILLLVSVGTYFSLSQPEKPLKPTIAEAIPVPPSPDSLRIGNTEMLIEDLALAEDAPAPLSYTQDGWISAKYSEVYTSYNGASMYHTSPSPTMSGTYSLSFNWADNGYFQLDGRPKASTQKMDGLNGKLSQKSSETPKEAKEEPTFTNRSEAYGRIIENLFLSPKDHPLSTFSIDVDAASYSNARRMIVHGSLPPRDAIRTEEFINYFDYDYPQPENKVPFRVISETSDCPWNPKHQLLHIGLQGEVFQKSELPPSNLVFLIDVSGSMSDEDKLPLLKKSFHHLVDELRKQDHVAIVVYAGAAGTVLEPTSGDQKAKILAALDNLESGGSTAGAEGIEMAYELAQRHFLKKGNNRVILATDGDFNVGPSSDTELVNLIEEKRKAGIFLSVLGFGTGNYQDDMMQQIADNGNGNHSYIDSEQEAKKVFVEEFGGTLYTIAKDVKLQIEFNPKYVAEYRLIGYENRLLRDEDFENDAKDAGDLGSGHTVTALYEIVPAKNWAKHKIPLKYQQTTPTNAAETSELATLKLRYKEPDGEKSKLITHIIPAASTELGQSSDNFRWSAAVAEFALLLLESEYAPNATLPQVIQLAQSAKGKDEKGYRAEFIQLVKEAKNLAAKDIQK